jgi:signal recognition particle subunit SRP54
MTGPYMAIAPEYANPGRKTPISLTWPHWAPSRLPVNRPRETFLAAHRDLNPEVTLRQRVAPSGAFVVWRRHDPEKWVPVFGSGHAQKRVWNLFENLTGRLGGVLDRLRGRGALTERDVNDAMREVRQALLEADVSLEVARAFVEKVTARAVGSDVIRSVTPGQMVAKIVHDELVATLGSDAKPIDLGATPPVAILMVGLQGSGKTTTTGKIAKRLKDRMRKKVLMASLDTRRPAAQEQLAVLGSQVSVDTLPIVEGENAVAITKRALTEARRGGYDVVMLDSAGRVTVDEELMQEAADVAALAKPHEILLVADALTGQDAVNTARAFDAKLAVTGIVLTRVDGDGRGGAALSMRAVTGKPIKLIGTGEKLDALEDFDPARIAGRILGMGDVVGLVERAAENLDAAKMQQAAEKMRKGSFDLSDLRDQLDQMSKMGGLSGLMGMMPGVAKMKNQMANMNIDDGLLKRQKAVIDSMTPKERRNPDILKASRKRRIAAGSGAKVEEINRLLKMHRQMADVMKQIGRGKGGGMLAGLGNMLGMGGGMGGGAGKMPSPEEIQKLAEKMPDAGKLPAQFPGLTNMPSKFPGLPGLGGINPLKKK